MHWINQVIRRNKNGILNVNVEAEMNGVAKAPHLFQISDRNISIEATN